MANLHFRDRTFLLELKICDCPGHSWTMYFTPAQHLTRGGGMLANHPDKASQSTYILNKAIAPASAKSSASSSLAVGTCAQQIRSQWWSGA